MTVMQQKTFGLDWGFMPEMPIAPHESDCRVCVECDEQTALRDWHKNAGCCGECIRINHFECTETGDWVHDDYCETNNRGEDYDRDEISISNSRCADCDDWTHDDDCEMWTDGTKYCECCYRDRFTSCDNCGEHHDRDDSINHEGETYCPDCSDCAMSDVWDASVRSISSEDYDRIGSRRTFGVEMETDTCDDHDDWARGHGWACCDDGSINGKEFVSPVLSGNAGFDSAKEFIDRMGRMGATVNDDCGFHLHIGVSDVSPDGIKAIALAYHYARNVFEGWVDKSRRDTYYARRNCDSKHGHSDQWDYDSIVNSDHPSGRPDQNSRYVWINWRAYDRFKTYEVRSHEPTCDGYAVCKWIKLHTEFADIFGKMTYRQVVRKFRHLTDNQIIRELRVMMDETVIDYYTEKSSQTV